MFTDAEITAALQRKGFKVTAQRLAICRYALASRDYPTAQQVLREVKKTHRSLSLATVYNTLRVLKELKLVRELEFTRRENRYDFRPGPHLNVVCLECGEIHDLNLPVSYEGLLSAVSKSRFTVTEQHLDFYGICQKCGERNASRSEY
jgi:Fur family peroxide stress response transcriptional regulator